MSGFLTARGAILRLSTRANSLHVGPNVKLRSCGSQPLEHVNVTVLHNGNRATLISNLLTKKGARVTHFFKEGTQVPDVLGKGNSINLDCADSRGSSTLRPYSKSELMASLKGADLFVDSSTEDIGMTPRDIVKINARLVYAALLDDPSVQETAFDAFDIVCALFGRERTSLGQVIILPDSATSASQGN